MVEVIDYQQTRDIQTERPQLPLLQTSTYVPFTSGQPLNMEVSGLNQSPIPSIIPHPTEYAPFQVASHLVEGNQLHHRHSVLGLGSVMGPSINVVPPTPMEHQNHHHGTGLPLDLGSGASSQETIIPSSPRLVTPRKQRFAMGPRADCEKCRLGIKGHFVHLE
ncbi:hypothetical protein P691DRAFT_805147 [Macrolepiota fuliginosa MF-IS2]|uniref:Uncharacterized protein n=1 Tax=Macrolepiota fuliginosa MF-IS2 TaxID=1400762 RepID=A0A9P5XNB6_9AGAR|nr:hypothetical protein P691DRAFT_805147 [Macrolepiota fuliginosa MF-IS2]